MYSTDSKKIDGIIFDFDGVIVDSEPWWEEADRRLVEGEGVRLKPEAKLAVIGLKQETTIRMLLALHGIEGDPELFMRRRESMMAEYYSQIIPLNMGVRGTLERLQELGVLMAVATSTPKRLVELSIDRHCIGGFFKQVVSADDVEHGKPAPDIFLKALASIGTRVERTLVVEDSKPGLLGAKAAGMEGVWLKNSFQPDAIDAASRIILSVPDLLGMI